MARNTAVTNNGTQATAQATATTENKALSESPVTVTPADVKQLQESQIAQATRLAATQQHKSVAYKPISFKTSNGKYFETTLLYTGDVKGRGKVYFTENGTWKLLGDINESGIKLSGKAASNANLVTLQEKANKVFNVTLIERQKQEKAEEKKNIRVVLDEAKACDEVADPFAGMF